MVATPVIGGFTQDIISLITIAGSSGSREMREAVQRLESPEERANLLREGLISVLSPHMKTMPLFVQQIVARAILDHVDWDAVVDRLLVIPENN